MSLNLGDIVKGKVTGITKFGAFIALPEGKSGMVHISEVSKSYVTDIHDFLTEGDMVDVKVIHVDEAGRINLSIKKAQEAERPKYAPRPQSAAGGSPPRWQSSPARKEGLTFEDKLKLFMADSESRMIDIKHQTEKKGGRGRKRG